MGEERSGGGIPKVYRVVRGWEPGSKGGRKSTGDGRREVGRWYSQGVEGVQGGEPRSKGGRKFAGGGRREGGWWDSQEGTGGRNPGVKEDGRWEKRGWEVGFPRYRGGSGGGTQE